MCLEMTPLKNATSFRRGPESGVLAASERRWIPAGAGMTGFLALAGMARVSGLRRRHGGSSPFLIQSGTAPAVIPAQAGIQCRGGERKPLDSGLCRDDGARRHGLAWSSSCRQRGFSIVSALFLLVVLAVLGAFMATFSSIQHTTSAMDVRGAQAYQAARAGAEWGIYQALRNTSCAPGSLALDGFMVEVTCTASAYTEGETPVSVYAITSTAKSGQDGKFNRVERQIQVTVSK